MKKFFLICILLLLILTTTVGSAACLHNGKLLYLTTYGSWTPLSPYSENYPFEHYRQVYQDTYCVLCNTRIDRMFDYVEWGDHTLPCSLCGANHQSILDRKTNPNSNGNTDMAE